MTSPLRRKRRITVQGWVNPAKGWATALLLLAGCFAGSAFGQAPPPPPGWNAPMPKKSMSILRTAYQPTTPRSGLGETVDLDPPGSEELFRLESESQLFERFRQSAFNGGADRIEFPPEPKLSDRPYYGRAWPRQYLVAEPNYVCHGRLYFEEMNSERYGWEMGIFQPLISAATFYKDFLLFPLHFGTDPCRYYDCSAGKCMPGDPVPYRLYPPELSWTGVGTELAVIGTLLIMFP